MGESSWKLCSDSSIENFGFADEILGILSALLSLIIQTLIFFIYCNKILEFFF